MKLSFVIAGLAAFVAAVSADYAAVKADVQAIDSAATKLNSSLQSTSGTDYIGALGIDSDANDLNKLGSATSDVNALTDAVTDDQANEIISILTGTERTTKSATDRLAALEPKFKLIGVAGIAKGDTNKLAASVKSFGSALVSKSPAAEKDQASALLDKFNADLANAVAAYASD